ncbi:MAG: hypothetical protein RIF32_17535 [Leptospirales bacterium]|jgi:hypothetical protein
MSFYSDSDSEFYVGYQHHAPTGLASFIARRVLMIAALAFVSGFVIAVTQNRFAPAVFEFGEVREFEGVVLEKPYPQLKVRRPGRTPGLYYLSSYYLVDPLKFSAAPYVRGLDGKQVRLRGELLYRENQTMLVLDPDSVQEIIFGQENDAAGLAAMSPGEAAAGSKEVEDPAAGDPVPTTPPGAVIPAGPATLTGEIIDSKCYLGAMNPGERKVHRACAIRCISGGIPPLFVVRTPNGGVQHLLLVSPEGQAVNQAVLEYVALPLRVTGEVRLQHGVYTFFADPRDFKRL